MRKSMKTILAALALATPLALTSCNGALDDIFGEWDKPSANTNSGSTPAASETYIVYTAAGVSKNEAMPTSYKEWTGTVAPGEYGDGFYVVSGTATCAGKLTLTGDVKIILKDNASLTVDDGITGFDDSGNSLGGKLTVYAQSTGDSKGKLIVNNNTPVNGEAHAINVVELSIHGGKITSTADTGTTPCDQGAGLEANGGDMTIYAGEITNNGAGTSIMVNEADLYIHGGTITTTSKSSSGIQVFSLGTTVGNLYITGGTLDANGKLWGPGINASNNITIDGGTVTGTAAQVMEGIYCSKLTINGGTVTANGGEGDQANCYNPKGGDAIQVTVLNINGGTITATGGNGDPLQNGNGGNGLGAGSLTINGGTLIATGGAGNGTGNGGHGLSAATDIKGFVSITATGGENGSTSMVPGSGFDNTKSYTNKTGGTIYVGTKANISDATWTSETVLDNNPVTTFARYMILPIP